MYGVAVYSANSTKLPRSEATLRSRAARESGRTFMWGLPPPHPITDEAHISGCHRKRGSSFCSEADPCPASLRGRASPSVLPHGQRPFSKSTTSSKPYIHNVCLKRRTEDIGERLAWHASLRSLCYACIV